ncbi:Fcf1-domain-containing protein [Gorgonomyces haynaldii]|nr:Fcf1-domain-containing protein [Gorgonomyces haynaldii]
MKVKRQKTNKRNMSVYLHSFGFRQPYQVILDGTFLQIARLSSMNLENSLERILVGKCRLMTTYCVYAELKKLGPDFRPTAAMAKKLEKRRCTHEPAVPASDCLKSIIGDSNAHNYCVATNDLDLRIGFRDIPGIPLIYINKSVLILEPPSQKTLEAAEQKEIQKTMYGIKPVVQEENKIVKRKKKEPNPLSIKKKKIVQAEEAPKKRKRARKPKNDEPEQ